jgi:chromosome segregation ATPase
MEPYAVLDDFASQVAGDKERLVQRLRKQEALRTQFGIDMAQLQQGDNDRDTQIRTLENEIPCLQQALERLRHEQAGSEMTREQLKEEFNAACAEFEEEINETTAKLNEAISVSAQPEGVLYKK